MPDLRDEQLKIEQAAVLAEAMYPAMVAGALRYLTMEWLRSGDRTSACQLADEVLADGNRRGGWTVKLDEQGFYEAVPPVLPSDQAALVRRLENALMINVGTRSSADQMNDRLVAIIGDVKGGRE
jgi:hypothetical protein